ncbi:MAG: flagellar type III secretion system pore protein FliP [Phycisphaeraceae bacterium]|nr:flagellar type III secretion system pore protein FliP [Phycisphaeraceae bacterium]
MIRRRTLLLSLALSLLLPCTVLAQDAANEPLDLSNPVTVLRNASAALPIAAPDSPATTSEGTSGGGSQKLSATLSILALLTVLTLAPALLVMCTSFTRIVVTLALLRQAIGTQSLPPSQVIVGLSMFLTLLVMAPTFERVNREFIVPMQAGEFENNQQAWAAARQPLRDFMFAQIEYAGNWQDVYMILNYRGIDTSEPSKLTRADVDMITLVPAFMLSELKVAFLIGFRLFLPFLIIDMVISSVLISMGMLMLPPVFISLPFKLLMFVLVDGWMLVAGNLLKSFAVPGVTT